MPKGYWIPHLDVSNPEGFQAYRGLADAGAQEIRLQLLVRGGQIGGGRRPAARARNVLREFTRLRRRRSPATAAPEYSARASAARAAFGMRFPDRRGLRRSAAAAGRRRRPRPRRARATGSSTSMSPIPKATSPIMAADPGAVRRVRRALSGARRPLRGRRRASARARTVVLEFPSYEAALACYRSPEYQAAKKLRDGKAEFDLVVIEG